MASENENGVKSFTAGEALEAYRRVKLSSGTVIYADAGDRYIGVTLAVVANGDTAAVKLRNHPGTYKMECAGAVTSGATVYSANDGMVDDAFAANGESIGIALDTGDGAGSIIEVLPQPKIGGGELLESSTGDSSALGTSSAAEATFSNGSYTFPAGSLLAGDKIVVKAKGRLDATNGSDTFTGRLKIGTETLATTPNPDAVDADIFMIDAEISINVGGASGFVEAMGTVMNDALAATLGTPFHKASSAEDLSGAVILAVTGQFDASSAGNTAKLDHFSVVRLRK